MAFTADITLSDGTSNHIYSDVGSSGLFDRMRREAAAPLDQPADLRISHQVTGTLLTTTNRSRVLLEKTVEDASGNQGIIRVSILTQVPVKIATAAQVLLVQKQAVAFASDVNLAKLNNLES